MPSKAMNAIKKTKTAVIGAGNMGKNHARVYSEISHLCAIADTVPETGRKLAHLYGAAFYTDYHEMLLKEKPDAVSVVVPTQFHKTVAMDCINAKVPVLVEKPLALTVKEAEDMLREAQKQRVLMMVGHIERFNPAIVKLRKIVDMGKLGNIISLLAIRVGISPPRVPKSDVSLDLGIHDIDVFNFILGQVPKSSKLVKHKLFNSNIADASSMLLEYDKASALIQTNWITPIKMRKLYVTGTEGFAEVDYINQKIILYNKILNPKISGNYYEFLFLSDNPTKEVYVSMKEPLKEELKYFLRNRNNYKETSHFGRDALKVLEDSI
jgi:UDP-N-acetylglucosamine 3-dehydrogenase